MVENYILNDFLLDLIRLGIGVKSEVAVPDIIDWSYLQSLAKRHWLAAVAMDGIEKIPQDRRPQKKDIIQWIGETIREESLYTVRHDAAAGMASLLNSDGIRTYILKGAVVAECYPKPAHRLSVDMDCYLMPQNGDEDVWERGNRMMEDNGFVVKRDYYKNSTFKLTGLSVENHRFFTPFRGNERLKRLERMLQSLVAADKGEDRFEDTFLFRPPVMASALFLIEHAYSHFLHEGLTWRHVLDWMMFSKKHIDEIDLAELEARIDEFGFRRFYDSFHRLGRYLLGEVDKSDLNRCDQLMLADIWAPLDLHETVSGIKGKLALAGNTWRARWKYRHFSEISMPRALWIQVFGYLFDRNPSVAL